MSFSLNNRTYAYDASLLFIAPSDLGVENQKFDAVP